MKKGDIVLVPFPFTDLSGAKNRPALVLISNPSDTTVAFISSKISFQAPTDFLISPNPDNGLKVPSLIRVDKLITLSNELILGRLGALNNEQMKSIDQKLMDVFQIREK